MLYKKNWGEAKIKWENYWKRQNTGRPLMCIIANKEEKMDPERAEALKSKDMDDKYLNAERIVERFRYFCETHEFMAESFPNLSIDFGPGSMAGYMGCNIVFNKNTVWFDEFVEDWLEYKDLEYDPENEWFKKHIELFRRVKELAGDDFYIGIPDIMENIDVLASMRGAQNTIFDMVDEPEEMERRIAQIDDIYFKYYDQFYDIVKDEGNGSCYTVFQIWGSGRTAKLQCDFSAMMSPDNFRDFIQPSLRKQAKQLDHVLYHLDGPDAIKHVDALMEIEEIDALQWTSGDYGPDGTFEQWYEIYDKAVAAGKGLWVKVYSGEVEEWLERLDKLVARYGSNALFLYFSPMPMERAQRLLEHAEKYWSDVEGSFVRELKEKR
jgi:5-methyltetrahydrofolate--homocysteine methyltransferase